MARFGWRSGYLKAQNVQAGTASFSSTEETTSVSFDDSLRTTGSVNVTPVATSTNHWVSTQDQSGFTAKRGSTGSSEQFNWIVMDDEA